MVSTHILLAGWPRMLFLGISETLPSCLKAAIGIRDAPSLGTLKKIFKNRLCPKGNPLSKLNISTIIPL